ncbi:MAG: type II toxin-antitoxin system mRNA interferase toxin, RelE/StbE family [Candidatus Paceibacterota bacterium]
MKIVFHKKFQKAFSKQSKSTQAKFKIVIQQFSEDEFHSSLNNHTLLGKYKILRSIDVTGDIRVHYKKESDTVVLVNIGTHSQLY